MTDAMTALARARRRTFEVLEVARPGDELSRVIDLMIMGLVVANVGAVVLESVTSLERSYHDWHALRPFTVPDPIVTVEAEEPL